MNKNIKNILLSNGHTATYRECDCCGERIYLHSEVGSVYEDPDRIFNYRNGLPGQCIIKNELFRKIAVVPEYKSGATAGTGFFCKHCMEKKLNKKIEVEDLFIDYTGTIPLANLSWYYEAYQEGKISKDFIISLLLRALESRDTLDYAKKYLIREINFYKAL